MADVTERIEKQMEGTNLALAAVAEVLQKMDSRLTKEDEQLQQNAQANARADLVKSIANEVLSVIKEDYQGLEVSGKERKAKSTGGTPQNADDSESGSSPNTNIKDQQNTIQAMRKQDGNGYEEEEEEDETQKAYKGMRKNEGYEEEDDDEVAELPIEEKGWDDEEEEEEPTEMKAMRKQIQAMKKQLEATEAGMQKAIQTESENRLRKMGFREENGLKAPKLTSGLGIDSTPIIKSNSVDVVDQLADLSYGQLRDLQHQIEMGNTDGLPQELLG